MSHTRSPKVSISVGDEEIDLRKELQIDLSDLSVEFAEQPSKYAYWAALEAKARHAYDDAKSVYQTVFHSNCSSIRGREKSLGGRATEKAIEQMALLEPSVKDAHKKMLEAKKNMDYLSVATEAFKQRLQSLISIGAQERAIASGLNLHTREPEGKGSGWDGHKEPRPKPNRSHMEFREEIVEEDSMDAHLEDVNEMLNEAKESKIRVVSLSAGKIGKKEK